MSISVQSYAKGILAAIVYGINTLSPDITAEPANLEYNCEILNCPSVQIDFVSSYLLFTDGTSSDIRVSYLAKPASKPD